MGGKIWFSSIPGKGTTFSFTLKTGVVTTIQSNELSDSDVQKSGYKLHVLVAEDNDINTMVIKKYLEKLGHTFTLVENGSKVLEALGNETFDVILMDCQMPVMDGHEATKKIIEHYGSHRPRIIALTAGVTHQEQAKCHQSGMDEILTKPLQINELELKLRPIKEAA